MSFFGQPSNEYNRKLSKTNIIKNQVVLSKMCNISISDSNNMTKSEFDTCFEALEEIIKIQNKEIK